MSRPSCCAVSPLGSRMPLSGVTTSATPPASAATKGMPKLAASCKATGAPPSVRLACTNTSTGFAWYHAITSRLGRLPLSSTRTVDGSCATAASTRPRSGPSPKCVHCTGPCTWRKASAMRCTRLSSTRLAQEAMRSSTAGCHGAWPWSVVARYDSRSLCACSGKRRCTCSMPAWAITYTRSTCSRWKRWKRCQPSGARWSNMSKPIIRLTKRTCGSRRFQRPSTVAQSPVQ
jgi:hypothetical protein